MSFFKREHRPIELLRYAGLFIWFCAGMPLLMPGLLYEDPLPLSHYLAWWAMYLVFGGVYWRYLRQLPARPALPMRLACLVTLTALAFGASWISVTSIGGVMLLVVAGLLPWLLAPVPAAIWLVGQNVVLAWVLALMPQLPFADAAINAAVFLAVSLFIFIGSVASVRQGQSRDELRKVNHELMATQALLAQNTRIAERVRISRELHDLVGHHLTALTLNLEVVTHLVEGKALEHVQQAHSLAKLLLADVREVVSDMRQSDQVDLADALRTLVEGVPKPRIHLDLPSSTVQVDPQRAQVLLRCVQEIITNSVRHARARNLWIRLSTSSDGLAMSARDDGRGTSRLERGNGLKGMSERLLALGGKLEIESARGAGFTLHAWLPMEG
ncbi:sensor histidine kinase [Marinihelvus fidelis]|uniref:Sensor histidine kinase n=2 Tax=Marinihelvus fidelis TaxID=2613842 RepID=A0A5N0T4T7_9GAMM|nr:sensor histidine kinase [Marinihelvus fidelis]